MQTEFLIHRVAHRIKHKTDSTGIIPQEGINH